MVISLPLLHDDSFTSLLKAAILSEVRINKINNHELINVNDFSLKRCLLEWEWAHEPSSDVSKLSNAVGLFILHERKDYELLFKVLRQALIKGSGFIFSGCSPEAVKFCSMVRSVRSEFHKARIFTKLREEGGKLFCNYFFSHRINDLLINHFTRQFPDKEVVFLQSSE